MARPTVAACAPRSRTVEGIATARKSASGSEPVRGLGEAALDTVFEARGAGALVRRSVRLCSPGRREATEQRRFSKRSSSAAFDSALTPMGITSGARVRRGYRARAFTEREPRPGAWPDEHVRHVRFGGPQIGKGRQGRTVGPRRLPGGPAVGSHHAPRQGEAGARVLRFRTPAPSIRRQAQPDRGALPTGKVADQEAWTIATVAGMIENYQEKDLQRWFGRQGGLLRDRRHDGKG